MSLSFRPAFVAKILLALLLSLASAAQEMLRVGYLPNIAHGQALVGRATGRFEQGLGANVRIEWKAFNAGPAEIEALFAKAVDLIYIGPESCD